MIEQHANNNNNKSLYLSKSLDTTHVCLYMILEYICYVNYLLYSQCSDNN